MKKIIGFLVVLMTLSAQASQSAGSLTCHNGAGSGFSLEFATSSEQGSQVVKIIEGSSGLSPVFVGHTLGLDSYYQSSVISKTVYINQQISLLYMTRKVFHHDNCGRGGCFDLPQDQILRIVQITTAENKQFNFQCSKN